MLGEIDPGKLGQGRQHVEGADGRSMRPGGSSGAAIISGTRTEPSKKVILNHRPRSPSMSP